LGAKDALLQSHRASVIPTLSPWMNAITEVTLGR
jgi:hypothetical protein